MLTLRPKVRGSVSQTIYLEMRDAATPFQPKTGFAFNTGGIIASYCKSKGARVAITPATLAAATTAWTSGGIKLVDDTNMPGVIRLDLPDAALADDGVSDAVIVTILATGYCPTSVRIPIVDKADVFTVGGTVKVAS